MPAHEDRNRMAYVQVQRNVMPPFAGDLALAERYSAPSSSPTTGGFRHFRGCVSSSWMILPEGVPGFTTEDSDKRCI